MKFIHLSDFHLGKRVNEYSMIEDQKYVLNQIINIIDEEKIEGVIIAGDIYDKSIPSTEAVQLFDDFLVRLSNRNLKVFVISGNHDSPERIAFGNRLMHGSGIYMSPVFNGNIMPVKLEDDFGKLNIWMIPFIKPVHVRKFTDDMGIITYTDAMMFVIKKLNIDKTERNIMITHQFVTGALRTDSEEISVGGSDNVNVSVFDVFDYTALGHIHRPQNCKSEKVRYCGTPLKYSFSESNDKKSVTVVELKEKGNLNIKTIPLIPMRDMVELKGKYKDLMFHEFYANTSYSDDYIHITLTDEEDIPNAVNKLRTVYHNLMKLDYDNMRTRNINYINVEENMKKKTPFEHFSKFYEVQNNSSMNDEQCVLIKNLIAEVWEETK